MLGLAVVRLRVVEAERRLAAGLRAAVEVVDFGAVDFAAVERLAAGLRFAPPVERVVDFTPTAFLALLAAFDTAVSDS